MDRGSGRNRLSVERGYGGEVMTMPRLQLFWLLVGAILFVVLWNTYQTFR